MSELMSSPLSYTLTNILYYFVRNSSFGQSRAEPPAFEDLQVKFEFFMNFLNPGIYFYYLSLSIVQKWQDTS